MTKPRRRPPHFLFLTATLSLLLFFFFSFRIFSKPPTLSSTSQIQSLPYSPPPPQTSSSTSPYHDWNLFVSDYNDMLQNLKIYVYPDVFGNGSSARALFSSVFLPIENPLDPKLGNYYSEHMFKIALMNSDFITFKPEEAHFYFLPFSINVLRNDKRVRSEEAIAEFVGNYVGVVSREFRFWNASRGADHFFVCCHSIGRDAVSRNYELRNNAVQVTCSSSYFQKFYVAHKDIGLPQVWPRMDEKELNPPSGRDRLVFFSGRKQNSDVRQRLIEIWGNDSVLDIYDKALKFSYEDGFRRSKYCLHVKGYEVNTARLSDAIHYGCVPVILSNYYDLPFANVFDWNKFSVIINHNQVGELKKILMAIPQETYLAMYINLCQVRRHFQWHRVPKAFDAFHMTAYQLWLKRDIVKLPIHASE